MHNILHSLSADIFILNLDDASESHASESHAVVQQEITNLKQTPFEKFCSLSL